MFTALNEEEMEEDYEEDDGQAQDESRDEIGVMQLLRQHRDTADEAEEYFGRGYDDEEYWWYAYAIGHPSATLQLYAFAMLYTTINN